MVYKVPFVNYPLHYHNIQSDIDDAIKEVLNGGDLIMRRQILQFENEIASFLGVKYAVGVNSGTDALYLSLLAGDIGHGDEVITVSHTFVATLAVIVHRGAKPILVDVADDFNMDMAKVETAISPRTKALMPVHLNGRLCDMEKLMMIANKHKLLVIEDAAQALGASFDGKKAGTFGIAGCFSFYPAKILGAFGEGGMVVTNKLKIAEMIRLLRDHGRNKATGDILCFGFNSRLDNLQAAILDTKLKHLPAWIKRRRELAGLYERGLHGLSQIRTPPPPQQGRYFDVYTNYVVRAQERDKLVSYLGECGIEILISWPKPNHRQEALGLEKFKLPETDRVSNEVLSLPLYPELTNDQVGFVIEAIRKFYKVR
ncbi:MAG: DegT/DnrJ/EryC1/StrS family aminotransferase [Chloroflexota bacterium]